MSYMNYMNPDRGSDSRTPSPVEWPLPPRTPAYWQLADDARKIAVQFTTGDRMGAVREIRDSARPVLLALLVASEPDLDARALAQFLDEVELDEHVRKLRS